MLDIFDILGPVMVGPSSSHTAGAVRIGRMARTLLGRKWRGRTSASTAPLPIPAEATARTGRWWRASWG